MTIGIECHVQLATKTKLFSAADNDSREAEPNSNVSAVDYGLPGMLPVLNHEAVRLAVRAGKALGSDISLESRFDRKHYFYPDLPKGYQTTQLYQPIIGAGVVEAPLENGTSVSVRIHHAHLEEDAGKLTHADSYSLVDLNRAGTPLIEIVSEPDIHSAAQARAFATELYRRMTYAGVTHGDLYHGNMRFDVNISVAKKGSKALGKRAEVKNLNSFRSVEKASEYEFKRQVDVLERGDEVVQETRGWDDTKMITTSQRSKEDAQDYRYMPDPDIPPIVLSAEEVQRIQADMPKLPNEYRNQWQVLEFDPAVQTVLLERQPLTQLIDALAEIAYDVDAPGRKTILEELQVSLDEYKDLIKRIANLFSSTPSDLIDLSRVESGLVGPRRLLQLALLAQRGKISSTAAKEIFLHLFDEASRGQMPEEIAKDRNLMQVSDEGAIAKIVDEVLADSSSQKALEDIRAGNDKAIGFLVGQVMKQSRGQANPALAQRMIRERL
jgi:aspartyl-tRNA(Asn)/glutamyl-tRNA(Gln) amidotransferase subunit B